MKITEIDEEMPTLGSSNFTRSPGIHLSDVLRSLNKTLNRTKTSDWDMDPTRAVGLLWEEVLNRAFADSLGERCGEICKDGVIMTPDGFHVEDWELEEAKATWRSMNRELTDPSFWDWFAQMKAYCYATGTQVARLRVLWVAGDYRGSGPKYQRYRVEFTENELNDNWQMLMNHKKTMEDK